MDAGRTNLNTAGRTNLNNVDYEYHALARMVLNEGTIRKDRTGVGTISVFGAQIKFENMKYNFPILTTKRVWWKGVVSELMWMLSGSTNILPLLKQNNNIWNDWPLKRFNQEQEKKDLPHITMEEFIGKVLSEEDPSIGELGPVYGRQWRNWTSGDKVMDQVARVQDQLRNDPFSRRIIMSAWNATDIDEMAVSGLPPCHTLVQFYTGERDINYQKNYLDCHLYMRSCDLFLGLPFNMAQYALLTHLMASAVDMIPRNLTISFGDLHIYRNHVDQLLTQLKRFSSLGSTPFLNVGPKKENVWEYNPEYFILRDYNPHDAIKAPVAV